MLGERHKKTLFKKAVGTIMGVSEDRLDKYPSGVSKFCDRMVERKKGWLTLFMSTLWYRNTLLELLGKMALVLIFAWVPISKQLCYTARSAFWCLLSEPTRRLVLFFELWTSKSLIGLPPGMCSKEVKLINVKLSTWKLDTDLNL